MTGSSWPPPGTPPPPRPPAGPGYRPPVLLARVVVVAAVIAVCVAAIATIAILGQMEVAGRALAEPGSVAADRLAAIDARRTALCRTVQLIDVVGLGLLAVWTRRLYANLRPLGFNEPRFREGWALGGWFVPLVNLVRPKQIVNDIWRAGDPEPKPAEAWEGRPVSSLLNWWWFLWVVLWLPTMFLGFETESARDARSFGSFLAWCGVGQMVFGALTIAVVVRTTSRQVRLAGPSSRPSSRQGSLHLQPFGRRCGSRDVGRTLPNCSGSVPDPPRRAGPGTAGGGRVLTRITERMPRQSSATAETDRSLQAPVEGFILEEP